MYYLDGTKKYTDKNFINDYKILIPLIDDTNKPIAPFYSILLFPI